MSYQRSSTTPDVRNGCCGRACGERLQERALGLSLAPRRAGQRSLTGNSRPHDPAGREGATPRFRLSPCWHQRCSSACGAHHIDAGGVHGAAASGDSAMSWAIWVTGLPGSGKSHLARATAAELQATGEPVVVLELDEIRKVITPSPTYSDTEREVVYRALVHMAAAVTESGTPVIIDATAHRREWRELARRLIPHFAEVQLARGPRVDVPD